MDYTRYINALREYVVTGGNFPFEVTTIDSIQKGMDAECSFTFIVDELLHDIAAVSYIQADIMPELESENARHRLFDIIEDEGIERTIRVMNLAFQECARWLRDHNKNKVAVKTVLDDKYEKPLSYLLEINLSGKNDKNTLEYIRDLIHEYIVMRVVADRVSILFPYAYKSVWKDKVEEAKEKLISSLASLGGGVLIRKSSPF